MHEKIIGSSNDIDPTKEAEDATAYVVENLSYKYDSTGNLILDDISFTIGKGEVVGIVGEPGSGKTTLLFSLCGIIPHFYREGEYRGKVEFNGRIIQEESLLDIMQNVALMFQDVSVQNLGLPAEDAIAFGMENLNTPREIMVERLETALDEFGIRHLKDQVTMFFSGGEQQATALASMNVMEPDIYLLDDVISSLDQQGKERVQELITRLRKGNKTTIIVDTNIEWIRSVADRLLILDKGKLIFDPALAAGIGLYSNSHEYREYEPTDTVVDVHNLCFSYGEKKVLRDISLQIEEGLCTAIAGDNGSGKTTLAKLMAGILKPNSGTVTVNGAEVHSLSAKETIPLISYVFQTSSHEFSAATVEEEFLIPTGVLGVNPTVSLEEFSLADYADSSPFDISAGQQQRLAIAKKLSYDPKIIILDEPTQGQTRKDKEELVERIHTLQRSGMTVVLISHDLNFVKQAAQYVHFMENGEVQFSGSAENFFKNIENDDYRI